MNVVFCFLGIGCLICAYVWHQRSPLRRLKALKRICDFPSDDNLTAYPFELSHQNSGGKNTRFFEAIRFVAMLFLGFFPAILFFSAPACIEEMDVPRWVSFTFAWFLFVWIGALCVVAELVQQVEKQVGSEYEKAYRAVEKYRAKSR